MIRFPGAAQHEAKRNDALQTRDRNTLGVWNDPGSAVHHCVLHPHPENALNYVSQPY